MSLTILTADELQNLEMRAANQLGADTLMKRAGAAAARKKGAPRARMSLPAEAEPHQNDQINEHKACKHVHDDFFLSIVSGRPTQTSESVPAATTT